MMLEPYDVVAVVVPDEHIGPTMSDLSARRDWGFDPRYDFDRAFREYLIPTIRQRYHR